MGLIQPGSLCSQASGGFSHTPSEGQRGNVFIHKQYRGLKAEPCTKEHSKCALGKMEDFLKGVTGERS